MICICPTKPAMDLLGVAVNPDTQESSLGYWCKLCGRTAWQEEKVEEKMPEGKLQIASFENGKYTLYLDDRYDHPTIKMERYREPWPAGESQFVGNKFLNLLVEEFFQQREEIARLKTGSDQKIDIVFDGPPASQSGRFIEVEEVPSGASVAVGEWIDRENGQWALRIKDPRAF